MLPGIADIFVNNWLRDFIMIPDSKVHGANMEPTCVLSAPDGPHTSPMNLAIRDVTVYWEIRIMGCDDKSVHETRSAECTNVLISILAPLISKYTVTACLNPTTTWDNWFDTLQKLICKRNGESGDRRLCAVENLIMVLRVTYKIMPCSLRCH